LVSSASVVMTSHRSYLLAAGTAPAAEGATWQPVIPCHRTSFGLDGSVVDHELQRPPGALPSLRVRIRDGQVEVLTV
jgi:hypothetical protein